MPDDHESSILILGVKNSGQRFRPSDWVDRISSTLATYGPGRRLRYSSMVVPGIHEGVKCLLVDPQLQQASPSAWSFIMNFASRNDLQILHPESAEREAQS